MPIQQKLAALKELQEIPGVGVKVAEDLWSLGIRRVDELAGQDPESLYQRLALQRGGSVDRFMLYVLRCAVYFASNEEHNPALLKWWNWQDN